MKNTSFMRIKYLLLFFFLFSLTSISSLYAQEEFDEGIDFDFDDEEGIMWGDDEESNDDTFDDFFSDEDDFFSDDEESFDDLDEFLEEDEEIVEEFETASNQQDVIEYGYEINLSSSSPSYVNNTLMNWNSFVDFKIGFDTPFTLKLSSITFRLGAEIITYSFKNYLPVGGKFSGLGFMGVLTIPAGTSNFTISGGLLSSSPAFSVGQSFGIPYGDNIVFKISSRANFLISPPDNLKEYGAQASWLEGAFTFSYLIR